MCWRLYRSTTPVCRPRSVEADSGPFYRCAGPAATPVPELIRVAAVRWAIEECFQTAKNDAGLDHYQVRGYRAWYAHTTLAMLAAYLAATRAQLWSLLCCFEPWRGCPLAQCNSAN
jgi:hypothetical protein